MQRRRSILHNKIQMTIGDVLAVVTLILAICFAAWGCIIAFALLFPKRSNAARKEWTEHPYRSLICGVLVTGVLLTIAIAMIASPPPLAKVFGMVMLVYILAQATIGVSGMAEEIGARIASNNSEMSRYASIAASAKLIVFGMLIPFLGTFLIAPLLLAGGFWTGQFGKFTARRAEQAIATPPASAVDA